MLGRPFLLTVATNSLKFRFDPGDPRHRYLWVDPPWMVEDPRGALVCDSEDAPGDGAEWRAWAATLDPLRTQTLCSVRYVDAIGTVIELSDGWRLRCLDGEPSPDAPNWYDDFYWGE